MVASFPDSRAFEKVSGEQLHCCGPPKSLWHCKSHQRGAGLYWYLSELHDRVEGQTVHPNQPWVGRKQRLPQARTSLGNLTPPACSSFMTREGNPIAYVPGGRSHLYFRSKALQHVQILEVQPSEYCASTLPAPTCTTSVPLKLQNDIAETSKEPAHPLSWELGTVRLSFPSFILRVTWYKVILARKRWYHAQAIP